MVERRMELKRRYHRKKKMAKLKMRLAAAKSNHDKEVILKKIHILSPWWQEPATT
jgi:ribosomal protein L18